MTLKKIQKKHKKIMKTREPLTSIKDNFKAYYLVLIIFLLAFLVITESIQIILLLNSDNSSQQINPKPPPVIRPVYIVDSQPIDIDVYLREFFSHKTPKKVIQVTVSAYSSTNGQTDDSPHVTAYGTPVRDGIVAANFLPVGTVIRFPDKFGDKLFVVEDKMNERYSLQVDIWMSDREDAKKFGIQYLKMEIF